jgi:dihydrodipicolinate synthase/N-acetylneuraminate lyase
MVEIYDLYMAGKMAEASALQKKLVLPEWGIGTSDVSGMKWIIAKERGYPLSSAHCRRPFPKFSDKEKQERVVRLVAPLLPVEEELRAKKV